MNYHVTIIIIIGNRFSAVRQFENKAPNEVKKNYSFEQVLLYDKLSLLTLLGYPGSLDDPGLKTAEIVILAVMLMDTDLSASSPPCLYCMFQTSSFRIKILCKHNFLKS